MATKKEMLKHEQWIRQIVREEIGKCLKEWFCKLLIYWPEFIKK